MLLGTVYTRRPVACVELTIIIFKSLLAPFASSNRLHDTLLEFDEDRECEI